MSKVRGGGGISLPSLSMDARSDESIHRYELKNQGRGGFVDNHAVKRFRRVLKKDVKAFGVRNSATNLMDPIALNYVPTNIDDHPEIPTIGYDDMGFKKLTIRSPVRGSSKVIVHR